VLAARRQFNIDITGFPMARFRFHKLASIVVLAGAAAWVLTGEFSSAGQGRGNDKTCRNGKAAAHGFGACCTAG
jgi:hypothetical protein